MNCHYKRHRSEATICEYLSPIYCKRQKNRVRNYFRPINGKRQVPECRLLWRLAYRQLLHWSRHVNHLVNNVLVSGIFLGDSDGVC
jgi:hypothetical protein